jgi:hypothetical protein
MRRAVALAALALAAGGCGDGLELRRDERLRFASPPEGARVAVPLVIRWSVDRELFRPVAFDGSRSGRRGVFAVFVDSSPMRPGRHLDTLREGDRICQASPGCPDAAWLADHGVYLTTLPQLTLPALPPRTGRRVGSWRRHEVTIVLLDGRGYRVGEKAWTRSFYAREGRRQ